MISEMKRSSDMPDMVRDDVVFVQQMLGELRNVAKSREADMLVFLIEMAFAESCDILAGKSRLKVMKIQGDKPTRMSA